MNWYLVKIIFGIKVGNVSIANQFEEQLRVVSARNENEAFLKARLIGVREEESFVNANLKNVKWEFVDVSELGLMDELNDGNELCSQIFENNDAGNYIRFIQQKAYSIEARTQQNLVSR